MTLREQIARAMFRSLDTDPRFVGRADLSPEHPGWRMYCHQADAALEAIEAAGFVLCPLEPTEEMVGAALTANAVRPIADDAVDFYPARAYRAMIAARPKP